MNSESDKLPDGLLAQLVEHSTTIPEVTSLDPVQNPNFFSGFFHNCLSCVYNCDDQS